MVLALFTAAASASSASLVSLCGFDFSKMNWSEFNEGVVLQRYGEGCGYEANAPSRKHVFYISPDGYWVEFEVIANDNWLVGVRISSEPLCDKKVTPKSALGLSRSLLKLAERDGRASYPQFTARRGMPT